MNACARTSTCSSNTSDQCRSRRGAAHGGDAGTAIRAGLAASYADNSPAASIAAACQFFLADLYGEGDLPCVIGAVRRPLDHDAAVA